MAEKIYNWTDDPMVSGVADCNTDVVNDCLMHLKYENTSDAIQNMYETGQVEKQTRGYNQLVEMKRSTFDKSKFTVVGNPTITDDGVASGFSDGNYLTASYNLKENSVYGFTVSGIAGSPYTERGQYLLNARYSEATRYGLRVIVTAKTNVIRFALGADSADVYTDIILKENQKYKLTVTTDFKTFATIKDELTGYTKTKSDYVITNQLYGNKLLELGNVVNEKAPLVKGSIDLKQVSITVDGKEVFNGNKTGIDTIKADNYEVVGSPVISDDGMASGFSVSNNIKPKSLIPFGGKSWEFGVNFIPVNNTVNDRYQAIFTDIKDTKANFLMAVNRYGNRLVVIIRDSTNTNSIVNELNLGDLNLDIINSAHLTYKNQKLTIVCNDSIVLDKSINLDDCTFNNSQTIGYNSAGIQVNYGSIDLNAMRICTNGNLVYQPCLKIPYTHSKTGSKIVNATYRDRVEDMYEQYGYAPYYTLDETSKNFTLPMGEIYGMIEDKADQIDEVKKSKVDKSDLAEIYPVVKTYVNGTSGYRIWSDGYCEQWGIISVSGTSTILLKPFRDTNYNILMSGSDYGGTDQALGSTSRTVNSFVYTKSNHGRFWKASGYLAEGWNNEGVS